jgi:hypothetical protein
LRGTRQRIISTAPVTTRNGWVRRRWTFRASRLESIQGDPPGNLTLNGKRPLRFHLEAAAQIVSVDFERYASTSATSFFRPDLLESTRVVVLQKERIGNPGFYPMLRSWGFSNLPEFTQMAAVTFQDVIVSHEPFSDALLFHELVHVEQYRQVKVPRFAELPIS